MDKIIKEFLRQIGRKGGEVKSPLKAQASRINGKKGGRPKGKNKSNGGVMKALIVIFALFLSGCNAVNNLTGFKDDNPSMYETLNQAPAPTIEAVWIGTIDDNGTSSQFFIIPTFEADGSIRGIHNYHGSGTFTGNLTANVLTFTLSTGQQGTGYISGNEMAITLPNASGTITRNGAV